MTFAEIVFRVGAAVGGWLIFTAHVLVVAAIGRAECDPGSDELWRGTAFFACLSAAALLLVGRGLEWRRSLRWLCLPALVLAFVAIRQLLPALFATTLEGQPLCSALQGTAAEATRIGGPAPPLERTWPPLQLAVLLFGVVQAGRHWLRAGRAATAALALLAVQCGGSERPLRPNLILITLDTTRADHLGLYGYPRPTSPNLDALAKRAAVYERAYSTSSWTLPSHASLFTGKYPGSHGVRHHPEGELAFREGVPGFRADLRASALHPSEETLARRLSAAGYETAAVVGGPWLLAQFGLASGFAHYDDEGAASAAGRLGESVTDGALAWLDGRGPDHAAPFFLFLNYFDAHAPYDPPPAWAGAFLEPGQTPDPGQQSQELALYDAEILYMDFELGRLLRGLADRGLQESTLLYVTADHGELFGEHGWRRHERYLWEPLVRVPLIVAGPGVQPERIDAPVSLVDVFHWVLEAAGVPAGRSAPPERLLAEVHPPSAAVKTGTWRALWEGSIKTLWSSRGELLQFDVVRDPGEQEDLLRGDRDRAQQAGRTLREAFGALPPPPARREVEVDEKTRGALEALGYLE